MINLSKSARIPAKYLNRHVLVTGQTGTGKTISVLKLTESLAQAGAPVFLSDVKGDMSCLARSCDTRRLDVLSGNAQVPLWAMGADLLSRALELSDTQSATLEIAFTFADQHGLPLNTLAELRTTLAAMLSRRAGISATLGQISPASVGVIQRGLLRLENAGASAMFGPRRLDISDLMRPGRVTILDARNLFQSPRLYGAFLLWLMREFWTRLPECGDIAAPRIALVFDEAHTLFADASPALLRATEQTARLIRSKGVSLILASQSPQDVPAIIAEQAATRLAHARALGVGNAELTTLDANGNPTRPRIVRPDLPSCGTTPADVHDMVPAIVPRTPAAPASDATAIGYAFLAAMGVAAAVLLWAIGAGYGGAMIAAAIGIKFAMR